ncbi:hypothetical protein IT397_00520, partial [Candidatus Nomurabacteria bacterium]|nr:hypothetical protein [Candidatus Nomurabacteria bacterium]
MNESEPKNKTETVSSYEERVKKGYSEFGDNGLGIENWGTMIDPLGERFNGYTDRGFINDTFTLPISKYVNAETGDIVIADLGG